MVVNWLIAAGTVGAVVVALFGKALRGKWYPPKFGFRILKPEGEFCPITDNEGKHIADGGYYHLKVHNSRTWVSATHVQLRLIRIEALGPDSQPQIVWDGDIPIRRRHQEFYPTESVIGSTVHYDLCAVVNTSPPTLSLMPIVQANNLPIQWKGVTHFVASFQMKSAERDSEIVRVQVDWDGKWEGGDTEIRKHFKLKLLRSEMPD